MARFKEVVDLFRERNFEKLKVIRENLTKQLFEKEFLGSEDAFYDLVGPGPYDLNRDQGAETSYIPDHCKRPSHHLYAVRYVTLFLSFDCSDMLL